MFDLSTSDTRPTRLDQRITLGDQPTRSAFRRAARGSDFRFASHRAPEPQAFWTPASILLLAASLGFGLMLGRLLLRWVGA